MVVKNLLLIAILGLFGSQHVDSAHIVFFHTCVSYSHRVSSWPLVEALIAKGHDVTFIGPYYLQAAAENPNVTEIVPKPLNEFVQEVINANFDVTNRAAGLTPKFVIVYDYLCYEACRRCLQSEEMQKWLSTSPKVDLIYADTSLDCSYGLAAKLNAKNALILPITFASKHTEAFGISPETSSIPDWDISFKPPLSFFRRVIGSIIPLLWRMQSYIFYPWYKDLFAKDLGLGENVPSLEDAQSKTSIIMINGDYIEDYPRSYPPMVIKVPGLHLKTKPKPLSKDIEAFVSSKDNDGFFYISFGTVAKGPNLPMDIRKMFFSAIESFPKIKFVWRWDGQNPESYPKNLMLKPWLEQEALLAHPRIKGFLTQAGRPSLLESSRNGVPTITFPILAEQDFNADRFELLGSSISSDIVGLSEESLKKSINELLTNNSYSLRAKQLAKLVKDVPMKPVETAVWWTEFVLRHTQEELSLLKPLSHKQSWFQRRELDTWAFLTIMFLISLKLTYIFGKWFFRKMCRRGADKDKPNASGQSNKAKRS